MVNRVYSPESLVRKRILGYEVTSMDAAYQVRLKMARGALPRQWINLTEILGARDSPVEFIVCGVRYLMSVKHCPPFSVDVTFLDAAYIERIRQRIQGTRKDRAFLPTRVVIAGVLEEVGTPQRR